MATLSPTALTAVESLSKRDDYLPMEAQSLRRCIAELYEECFDLAKKAAQEGRRRKPNEAQSANVWDLIGMYPDDIRGYASYAQKRVPIAYPPDAVHNLKQYALFELPGVLDWLLTEGPNRPKMRHYLETVDYLRLQVLDYIQRFDQLTIDQKTF